MSIVPILTVPNKVLLEKCTKVKDFGPETKQIVQNLLDTIIHAKNPEGAGLAAPQIGVTKRIIIARRFLPNPDGSNRTITHEHVLINPRIISSSDETQEGWEGCLSIPNTYGKVRRPKKIKLMAQDENGDDIRMNASGFFARVIQHEIDHLDGILFTTKIIGKTLNEHEYDQLEDYEDETVTDF